MRIHEAWWLWPDTCLMRYPGRGNAMLPHVVPAGPDLTRETWDFYLEEPEPNAGGDGSGLGYPCSPAEWQPDSARTALVASGMPATA